MVVALSTLKCCLFVVIGKEYVFYPSCFFVLREGSALKTHVSWTHSATSECTFVCPRHSAVHMEVSWHQNNPEAPHCSCRFISQFSACGLWTIGLTNNKNKPFKKVHSLLGISEHLTTTQRCSCKAAAFASLCWAFSFFYSHPQPVPTPP